MRSHPKIAKNGFLALTRILCILQKKLKRKVVDLKEIQIFLLTLKHENAFNSS
ncbi:hypothetical protein TSAR_014644 [Trichomalopsis sarcophagae]|uniref:Uncharacterized protein n=1 Tax=Trichomalopsis sarcophagae TaxID=543379 RepID=A0A232EH52_9HYME|nr:hypothetical protein TSAR_014644 [Trichomalopsis sarcophagae]